ncbi:hypothetical protein BLAT2472_40635 [Burkholderia latens]
MLLRERIANRNRIVADDRLRGRRVAADGRRDAHRAADSALPVRGEWRQHHGDGNGTHERRAGQPGFPVQHNELLILLQIGQRRAL